MDAQDFEVYKVQEQDLGIVHELAHEVWPLTFRNILSLEQIDYMLEMMYSVESLKRQREEGCDFFLLKKDLKPVGYLSLEHNKEGNGKTKIHKIYLLPEVQGTGAGRFLIDHAFAEAKKQGSIAIYLNVNRYNKAIGFYEHCGFKKVHTEDIDIGQGYLMEDWVMEKAP